MSYHSGYNSELEDNYSSSNNMFYFGQVKGSRHFTSFAVFIDFSHLYNFN